jgi:hypothetical protein
MAEFTKPFNAPIPGESLTNSPGSSPYEKPAQFADPNDALEYLFDKLTDKRQVTRIAVMLKAGLSAEDIAKTMLFAGFTNGKWTPDTAMMMLRIVVGMVTAIGQRLGLTDFSVLNKDKEQYDFLSKFPEDVLAGFAPSVEEETVEESGPFKGML